MGKKLVATLSLLSLLQYISATSVICYHGTWSQYRAGNGKFSIKDVPANLCTHYIYAFVGLDSATNTVMFLDEWLDITLGGFADATALKKINPDLKVLVAIGGWNQGSARFSAMAASSETRATFIASALAWVQKYKFDGFDLDWEYPGRRNSNNPADKQNFALLVKEMYTVFNANGLLLTAAVSATPSSVDISYDVPSLSKYLDFINVMTYDFHVASEHNAGHNAPLFSAARYAGTEYADYSLNASISGWLSRGASPAKIALGVPVYGRTFQLSSPAANTPGSPTTGKGGPAGPYTVTPGILSYNEIVDQFSAGGWTRKWDYEQQVPYAHSGSTWLSYDNEKSLAIKVALAKHLGLGAIMIWSLESEDFLGLSGTKFPLLNAIRKALDIPNHDPTSSSSASATPEKSTSPPSSTSSTSSGISTVSTKTSTEAVNIGLNSLSIASAESCTAPGYFRCSLDCSVYYYCQLVNGRYVGTTLRCIDGLYYDPTVGVCNYAKAVAC